jgi:membrane protein insertase Oxa1/YidC/SpoIIIJ
MKQLAHNIHLFDDTLFGIVNLGKSALPKTGGIYWPAMVIVLGSAVAQYFQSKQLLPTDKDQRSLRQILKSAGDGKQADQAEVNAAVGRSTRYFLPVMIFIFTVNLASALSLYWLTGGIIAYIQQSLVLRKDETEMEDIADKPSKKDVAKIEEGEVVVGDHTKKVTKKKKAAPKKKAKKRRS